ncbi:hypothetical protein J9325_08700 [Lacticaseibacillus paracasei]|uniref:hypothetical protein n=1 Tax=Lacticaseibacillus paracasei TaxID=1597 RepID=UPI0003556793|nr:hypothetical protein [Lacticaseibacillus paracasei]AGP69163.1 Hypothetical protein LOCK919_2483 [Lacticaseibacillus paracasei]QTX17313.1 hypothetical protein J9325_08700 [Lacticaseibacillus paracasei]
MSNETKRDVFEKAVDALADAQASGGNIGHQDANLFMAEYEKALPDDLPVIPEAQSDWIKQCKAYDYSLSFALDDETAPIEVAKTFRVWGGYTDKNKDKWLKLQNTFARAWVLGVWRVEETGEIVKLEAEK